MLRKLIAIAVVFFALFALSGAVQPAAAQCQTYEQLRPEVDAFVLSKQIEIKVFDVSNPIQAKAYLFAIKTHAPAAFSEIDDKKFDRLLIVQYPPGNAVLFPFTGEESCIYISTTPATHAAGMKGLLAVSGKDTL